MNETKINHYKKCSHYMIGASFDSSISSCFLYYSDKFMSGKCEKDTKHKGEVRPKEGFGSRGCIGKYKIKRQLRQL